MLVFAYKFQFYSGLLSSETGVKTINENFEEIAPRCFIYEQDNARSKAFSKLLRESYFPFDTIDVRSFTALDHLFGDSIIGYGVNRFIHLVSSQVTTYYYKFSFTGRYSAFIYPHDKPYGVHHGDDLQYIFNTNLASLIRPTDPENFIVERMTRIVEQFVHTG